MNFNTKIVFYTLCTLCVINLFSCNSNNSVKFAVQELTIEREGQIITTVKAEIAVTQEERSRGLMYRENLPDGEGMLFVFESDQILSFWMKNTYIPLTIAYISSNGKIVDILDMYPHDENSVASSRSVRYALEVPQGWFFRVGVQTGDIVKIDDLKINR
jgi:uncharacterized membrane protein (UPF0127 family)